MNLKKIPAILLCIAVLFSQVSCGKETDEIINETLEETLKGSITETPDKIVENIPESQENDSTDFDTSNDISENSEEPRDDQTPAQTASYPDIRPNAEMPAEQVQSPDFQMQQNEMLKRVNYYNSEGMLLYYYSYAYYDDGRLCSTTLYAIDHYSDDFYSVSSKYTLLCLYESNGNLNDIMLDALTISSWFNRETGEVTLDYEYGENGSSSKITIFPATESIAQKKFGVDPEKTEEIYGKAPIIMTDSGHEWSRFYLDNVFSSEAPTDMTTCRFMYVNDDSIPELWIDYGYGYAGAEIYTTNNSTVHSIALDHGGAYWIENENIMLVSYGHMDNYYDIIYTIEDGAFHVIAEGHYGALNHADTYDRQNYQYYWNDTEITEEEYSRLLASAFDKNKAVDIYQNVYTYEQCKLLLEILAKQK